MNPYIQLTRPLNCIMSVVGVIVGAIVGIGLDMDLELSKNICLAFITASIFTAAGNAMNDYLDSEIDKINHPERPIPSGKIKSKQVLYIVIIGFSISFFLGFLINWICFFIVLINAILMYSYEKQLKNKGVLGNLTISWLTGSLFLFGGAAVDEIEITIVLAFLAFLATFGREIIKDIEDIKGDVDRKTLPKVIGIKGSGIVASISLIIAVSLSFLPVFPLDIFDWKYLIIVAFADITFIISIIFTFKDPKKASKTTKIAMFLGLIAFLFGSII